MNLIIVSGRSGAGKTTALHELEDMGFYCVDNLPLTLIPQLVDTLSRDNFLSPRGVALGVDARNSEHDLMSINQLLTELPRFVSCRTIFIDARDEILIQRFSETRRRHPLSKDDQSLTDAIALEQERLTPLASVAADLIDSSELSVHGLRDLIRERYKIGTEHALQVTVQSFGFKKGIPLDADLVFDVRMLPNPHWEPALRHLSGLDEPVREFLIAEPSPRLLIEHISQFVAHWLPDYSRNQRSYLMIGIGCTGGKHRSVFVAEAVATQLRHAGHAISVKHRDISVDKGL